MAKRKKTNTTKRRVSGTGKKNDVLTNLLMLTGGAIAGKLVANLAKSQFDKDGSGKLTPEILAAAQIGIGAFLVPKLVKGNTGQMLGYGMAVNGGIELAEGLKIPGLSGIADQMNFIGRNSFHKLPPAQRVSGTGNSTTSQTGRLAVIGELERAV